MFFDKFYRFNPVGRDANHLEIGIVREIISHFFCERDVIVRYNDCVHLSYPLKCNYSTETKIILRFPCCNAIITNKTSKNSMIFTCFCRFLSNFVELKIKKKPPLTGRLGFLFIFRLENRLVVVRGHFADNHIFGFGLYDIAGLQFNAIRIFFRAVKEVHVIA